MTRNSSQNLKNEFQECCYSLLSCYFYLFNNNSQTTLNKPEQNTTQTVVEATLGFAQPSEIPLQISTNPNDNIPLNSPNSNPRPFNIDPHIANSSKQQ
jgi:hypothetical protein